MAKNKHPEYDAYSAELYNQLNDAVITYFGSNQYANNANFIALHPDDKIAYLIDNLIYLHFHYGSQPDRPGVELLKVAYEVSAAFDHHKGKAEERCNNIRYMRNYEEWLCEQEDKKNHQVVSSQLLKDIEKHRAKSDHNEFLQHQVKILKNACIDYFKKDLFSGNNTFAALSDDKKIARIIDKLIKHLGFDYTVADKDALKLIINCEYVSSHFQSTEAEKNRYETIVKLREYRANLCAEKGYIKAAAAPGGPKIAANVPNINQIINPVNIQVKPQTGVLPANDNNRYSPTKSLSTASTVAVDESNRLSLGSNVDHQDYNKVVNKPQQQQQQKVEQGCCVSM